ncbi:putative germin-like protein subfamily 1 member 2 [Eutrema salsugineum]|nr:putative germin-like protein subfamily 1 member 2 [Eutrema salsugineum]
MEVLLHLLVAQVILLALASSFVSCYDPSPLQDFCVAANNNTNGVFVNGKFCKDPKLVTANDFFTFGLKIPGNTSNRLGSMTTTIGIPGLNTLGVTIARIDFSPGGQVPPHIHPRATEILLVLEGRLLVGFVSSNIYNNTLFSKILNPGDVFLFPVGLIQFHVNVGKTNAVAIAAAGSQNPGLITIGDAIFRSNPFMDPMILAKACAFWT